MATKLFYQLRLIGLYALLLGIILFVGARQGVSAEKEVSSQITIHTGNDGNSVSFGDSVIISKIERHERGRPRLGVFLDNLSFEKAYKLHYDYTYGVLVTDVIPGSAADRAGLMEDDIIMEFDGQQLHSEDQLSRLVRAQSVGKEVKIQYFRDGTVNDKNIMLGGESTGEEPEPKSPRTNWREQTISGGSVNWIPYWYVPENIQVYNLIKSTGFEGILKDPGFGDEGLLMHNININVGAENKWAFGFNLGWYSANRNTSILDGTTNYKRHMSYDLHTYMFTGERRIALLRGVYLAPGAALGWGWSNLTISQTDGDFVWNQLNNKLNSPASKYVELERGYLLFQPKISLVVKLTHWLGIQGTAGYLMSYSYHSGWNANVVGDKFDVKDSPESTLNGMVISIGPWFTLD